MRGCSAQYVLMLSDVLVVLVVLMGLLRGQLLPRCDYDVAHIVNLVLDIVPRNQGGSGAWGGRWLSYVSGHFLLGNSKPICSGDGLITSILLTATSLGCWSANAS